MRESMKTEAGADAGIEMVLEQTAPAPPAASATSVAHRLVRGSSIYALTNFGLRAMNFLLIALYTRYLTPGDYGIISLAEITGATVATATGLGLDASLRRLYFQYTDRPSELRHYVSTVLRFAFATAAAVVVLGLWQGPRLVRTVAPEFIVPFYPYLAIAIASACVLHLLDYFFAVYQVQERPRAFAMLSLLLFVLTAAAVISLVILRPMGARGLLTGKLAGAAVALLVAALLARRWLTAGFQWRYIRETLRLGLPIVPHSLLALGLIVADRLILEHYRPLAEVGIYSLAYTFGMVMFLVTSSLSQAWSPIFYDLAKHGEQNKPTLGRIVSAVMTVLTLIACLGACISQDFLRLFLDARYSGAGALVPWIIGGYLLHALFTLLQLSALQARKSQLMWVLSLAAFTVNIVLNFAWVPRWGMFGAAWATAAGYAVEALLMYFYAQRVFKLPLAGWRIVLNMAVFGGVLGMTQVDLSAGVRVLVMLGTFLVAAVVLVVVAGREFQASVRMLLRRRTA